MIYRATLEIEFAPDAYDGPEGKTPFDDLTNLHAINVVKNPKTGVAVMIFVYGETASHEPTHDQREEAVAMCIRSIESLGWKLD